jgi:ATP-dependent DNA helicase RecQ
MMGGYADTTGCRRQFLLGYFGEHLELPCGGCDTCEAGTARRRPSQGGPFGLNDAVSHEQWGAGVVMTVEEDRLTVLFDEVGYRTLSIEAVEDHGLLRPVPAR